MRRLPITATLVVLAAVAVMIGLGLWQLDRAQWKARLLERYDVNAALAPVAFPVGTAADDSLLYRRAEGQCLHVTGWAARAGRDRTGRSGWRHVAQCRTATGDMAVDFGWSVRADNPVSDVTGRVTGRIAPDSRHVYLLVADHPAPGLAPSAAPTPAEIPNNHRSYAVQWFFFAGVALLIYLMALRQKLAGNGRAS